MSSDVQQEAFNRIARAVFAALMGFSAGSVCLFVGTGDWMAIGVAAIWTASVLYGFNEPPT